MTRANDPSGTPKQPALAELMARFLAKQTAAHAEGLVAVETGEVVPHEAAPAQPVDPQAAWSEALAAVRFFQPKADTLAWQAPPTWPLLVASQEPLWAPAFCLGNYPQLVRNLQPLLQAANLADLGPSAGRPISAPALLVWAEQATEKKQFPQTLLALAALRLARQFDSASQLVKAHKGSVPAEWRSLWMNEEAALAWQQGRTSEAAHLWDAQLGSVPVYFNQGMAALFLGQPTRARSQLRQAVEQLPETSGWHHLGRLYLTLAEMRI